MAEAALKKFGRIDYLINNAALRQEKAIEHMTFEDWRHIIGVILDGAFHCVKACLDADQEERRRLDHQRRRPDRRDGRARPRPRRHRQGRHRRLHPRAGDGACAPQDHRQHAGARHAGAGPTSRTKSRRIRSTGRCSAAPPGRPTSRRWRASWSVPARATSPASSSTSTAARISTCVLTDVQVGAASTARSLPARGEVKRRRRMPLGAIS